MASQIALKQKQPYSKKLFWLRCKLRFSSKISCHVPSGFPLIIPQATAYFLHHPLILQLLSVRSTFPKFKTFYFMVVQCKNLYICKSATSDVVSSMGGLIGDKDSLKSYIHGRWMAG